MNVQLGLVLMLLISACGDANTPADSGVRDAATQDAATQDAATQDAATQDAAAARDGQTDGERDDAQAEQDAGMDAFSPFCAENPEVCAQPHPDHCDPYEDVCGYGGPSRFVDRAACISFYIERGLEQCTGCLGDQLNIARTNADEGCPGASGLEVCAALCSE